MREFSNCPYWEFLGKESLTSGLNPSIVLATWVCLVIAMQSLDMLPGFESTNMNLFLHLYFLIRFPRGENWGCLWSAMSCTCSNVFDCSIYSFSFVNCCTAFIWSSLLVVSSSECLATEFYLVRWYLVMLVLYIPVTTYPLHPRFKKGHSSPWRCSYFCISGPRK